MEIKKEILIKYKLNEMVFYMRKNKIHSANITSIKCISNLYQEHVKNAEQEKAFMPYGKQCTLYHTCHGDIIESDIYRTREELLESL